MPDTGEPSEYHDQWIECTPDEVRIRAYYFPWGTKCIAYASIKHLYRFEMSALRGKGRIWGTGTFKYWASLDPKRPRKSVGLIIDNGQRIKPFITPDDPDAVEAIIRRHAGLSDGETGPSPFI